MQQTSKTSLWTGLALGMLGGAVGLLAMRAHSAGAAKVMPKGQQEHQQNESETAQELKDISPTGQHHQPGESSTAALGRMFYQGATGKEPNKQTKTALSYSVHWGYGLLQGSLYGALRRGAGFPDIIGGFAFSIGLWLLGDELAVPMLGLQSGPTAEGPRQHANRFGAHLAYGLTTAVATQALLSILAKRGKHEAA
jgi:hypothetical protein